MPEQAELWRKDGQRGLLIASYERLKKKDSDRAITPVEEAVCVPAHSAARKAAVHLHTQLSLGQSCQRQKSLASMCTGSLWQCLTLCYPVDCGLPKSGGSPGKNTGAYWPTLVSIPS